MKYTKNGITNGTNRETQVTYYEKCKLLTVSQTAEYLNMGESTLRRIISEQQLKGCIVVLGKKKMVNKDKLDKLIDNLSF